MTSPAQVSGPGELSRRTDAGGQPIRELPDPKYGEATQFRDMQKAAPLSAGEPTPNAPYPSDVARIAERSPAPPTAAPVERAPMPGLFDRGDPSVPMTSGAPVGAGPNSIPGLPGATPDVVSLRQALEPYYAADTTGALAAMAQHLAERGLW